MAGLKVENIFTSWKLHTSKQLDQERNFLKSLAIPKVNRLFTRSAGEKNQDSSSILQFQQLQVLQVQHQAWKQQVVRLFQNLQGLFELRLLTFTSSEDQ